MQLTLHVISSRDKVSNFIFENQNFLLKFIYLFDTVIIYYYTLFRKETAPLAKPIAKYCPVGAQAQLVIRPETLCFCTAFTSADQNAKSERAQDAK